ncbi:unnamed protein product [Calypogeia fissa]
MKAKAIDRIRYCLVWFTEDRSWCGADRHRCFGHFSGANPSYFAGEYLSDCVWDTVGLSSDPETSAENRTVKCWYLTMGRLSGSGKDYSLNDPRIALTHK